MYHRELVAIIRKIIETNNDTEFLLSLSAMAADEIERLGRELESCRTPFNKPYGN